MINNEVAIWPGGSIRLVDQEVLEMVGNAGTIERHSLRQLDSFDIHAPKRGRVGFWVRFQGTLATTGSKMLIEESHLDALRALAAAAIAARDALPPLA